jgi:glucokinase
MILAGDIGGTKTNLALVREESGRFILESLAGFPSKGRERFGEILREYLAAHPATITRAAFGIAGPVVKGRCEATNLPWIVDAAEIAERLRVPRVGLLNDLEATAYGVLRLKPQELLTLNPGTPRPQGTIAVIAAGTGLGEGGLVWTGDEYRTLPSEGGHADFAPRNDLEIELLRFLLQQHDRVSYERILSGPGLVQLYRFFRHRTGTPEPEWLKAEMAGSDAAAAVSRAALEEKDGACSSALELFVSIYGAEAGNLALKLLAFGGVCVAGGIAPKILRAITSGGFMSAFTFKGRFSPLLAGMPVHVVLNDKAAILGAAHYALMDDGQPL